MSDFRRGCGTFGRNIARNRKMAVLALEACLRVPSAKTSQKNKNAFRVLKAGVDVTLDFRTLRRHFFSFVPEMHGFSTPRDSARA